MKPVCFWTAPKRFEQHKVKLLELRSRKTLEALIKGYSCLPRTVTKINWGRKFVKSRLIIIYALQFVVHIIKNLYIQIIFGNKSIPTSQTIIPEQINWGVLLEETIRNIDNNIKNSCFVFRTFLATITLKESFRKWWQIVNVKFFGLFFFADKINNAWHCKVIWGQNCSSLQL